MLFDELRESLQRADRTLFERARSNPALHGMGTTLTMAYSVASDLYIVHAGDSRAYLFRDGQLEQVTADHTIVQALVNAGMISAEEARHHHRRHVVTNVLGGPSEGVYAEIHKLEIRDGDILVFCTDGLTEPVPDADIAEVLASIPIPTMRPGPSSNSPSTAAGPTTSPSSSPGTRSIAEVPRADDHAQSPTAPPRTFLEKFSEFFSPVPGRTCVENRPNRPADPPSVFANLTHTVDRG